MSEQSETRIYMLLDDDSYPGHSNTLQSQYVVAKNRTEAKKKAKISFAHVKWCNWLKLDGNKVVDEWGNVKGEIDLPTQNSDGNRSEG